MLTEEPRGTVKSASTERTTGENWHITLYGAGAMIAASVLAAAVFWAAAMLEPTDGKSPFADRPPVQTGICAAC